MKNPFFISVYVIILFMFLLTSNKGNDTPTAPSSGVATPTGLTETLTEPHSESEPPAFAESGSKDGAILYQ